MEEEITGYYDKYNSPIYFKSILRSNTGAIYLVDKEADLGYVITDVFKKTSEKLTLDICKSLMIINQDQDLYTLPL